MHPVLCIFFETSLMHGYTAICKKPFVKELPLNLLKNYPYPLENGGSGTTIIPRFWFIFIEQTI